MHAPWDKMYVCNSFKILDHVTLAVTFDLHGLNFCIVRDVFGMFVPCDKSFPDLPKRLCPKSIQILRISTSVAVWE